MKNYIMICDSEYVKNDIYNFGYVIIENKQKIEKTENFLIRENIKKYIHGYNKKLDGGTLSRKKRKIIDNLIDEKYNIVDLKDFKESFIKDIEKYHIQLIWGYNVFAAETPRLNRIFTDGELNNIIFCDIMQAAKNLIMNSKKYNDFCYSNEFLTKKKKQPSATVQTCYRYLTNNIKFIEEHTALADSLIEYEILKKCYKYKKTLYIKAGITLSDAKKNK